MNYGWFHLKAIKIITPVMLAVLAGCSSTKIHLHANNLPKAERESIRHDLEVEGFSVLLQDNEPPSDHSVILFYPHEGIDRDLDAIDNVLDRYGLQAEHSFVIHETKLGVHEYTAGNIGVYLVPVGLQTNDTDRVRSVFPIAVTDAEFVSVDCGKVYVYEFYDDGQVTLNDFSLPMGEAALASGNWLSDSGVVTIVNHGEVFEYTKSQSHREYINSFGEHVVSYNITLRPNGYYRVPFGCTFKSTFAEAF